MFRVLVPLLSLVGNPCELKDDLALLSIVDVSYDTDDGTMMLDGAHDGDYYCKRMTYDCYTKVLLTLCNILNSKPNVIIDCRKMGPFVAAGFVDDELQWQTALIKSKYEISDTGFMNTCPDIEAGKLF